MTPLVLGTLAAVIVQIALHSVHVWWFLASCQPLLLVVVAAARRFSLVKVAWSGFALGLLSDVLADRLIGPGGIAGAAAGAAIALVVARLELEGPLFWLFGALAGTCVAEGARLAVMASLGVRPAHGLWGLLAAVATTVLAAMVVALVEKLVQRWRSPERRRRRVLKRL